jgi:lysozyme family protein
MSKFYEFVGKVLKVEGGYVNDHKDSGGETNWGVTIAVARAFGYQGAMRDMTREQALEIYKARFWDSMRLDSIAAISPQIAYELFDSGVNVGTQRAGEWFQTCLNAFNQEGTWYKDITVDGRIGPMTIAAFRDYMARRARMQGERVMLRALNALQGEFYIDLSQRRQKDERFVYGWILNRVEIA